MRLPIGEEEYGAFWKSTDGSARFVRTGTWAYEYATSRGARTGTYKEFKELYPYPVHGVPQYRTNKPIR